MHRLSVLLLAALVLSGCAAYKELKPDPDLMPVERGYVELKNGKEVFELSRDKKYFIRFPAPAQDHFKLVLTVAAKPALGSFLTRDFEGKEPPFTRIADETAKDDSTFVYAVDPRSPQFFWVVDTVKQDLQLVMHYRYVPEWRYTFEVRYATYRATLEANTLDRSPYERINASTNIDAINLRREAATLEDRSAKLRTLDGELKTLAAVFPANIAATRDTAYKQYVELNDRLADEIDFQTNYAALVEILRLERDSRGDITGFIESMPALVTQMRHVKAFPTGAGQRIRSLIGDRLDAVVPHYEQLLAAKTTVTPIVPQPSAEAMVELFRLSGRPLGRDVELLARFIERFNTEAQALQTANAQFRDLDQQLLRGINGGEGFFQSQLSKAAQIKRTIPDAQSARMEKYGNVPCAGALAQAVLLAQQKGSDEQMMYEIATRTVASVSARDWANTEAGARQLAEGTSYSSASSLLEQRLLISRRFEGDLFAAVKQASQQRVDQFAQLHESTYENVPALYQDSVFTPVYRLTFSSEGPANLAAKRKQIDDYLDQIKTVRFPENSIKAIYANFIRNVGDKGVEKTRAIVEHGKFYRGVDKQVKGLIDECNPMIAKWITKPKEYRKLYALPITTSAKGPNEYVFRIGLNIPSEAQFPVFDINIKLPPEVAQKAGSEQWYQEITLNKKAIKNEGRFRITAPVADNGFESQISPVQMDKAGSNVLEIHFKYPGFRVFEVSTMAQVPLIRKN